MTTVPPDGIERALDRYVAGEWLPRLLPALELVLDGHEHGLAFNDVAVLRRGGAQARIAAYVDGELFARFAGDGCVVATPLGSSAYTIGAGGPLLPLGLDAFCLTPLATHGGFRPPLVIRATSTLELNATAGHGGARVEVDGQASAPHAERLTLRITPAVARIVTFEDQPGFVTRLRESGVVSDSPRILAEDERLRVGDEASTPGCGSG